MPQGTVKVTAQSQGNSDMVRERLENGDGMKSGEMEGVDKPIKITSMLLSGPRGVCHMTMTVPLGRKIGRGGIPIPSEEPRDPAEAGQELLELGVKVRPDLARTGVRAGGPVHRNYVQALGTCPWDSGMSTPIKSGSSMDL